MTEEAVVAVLNALLAAEQQAIAPRLFESTVFVAGASIAEVRLAERLVAQSRSNQAALADRILELGGEPGPRRGNPTSGDLHYLEVHSVLPRVIADYRRLLEKYRLAGPHVSGDPESATLVSRLTNVHEHEFEMLTQLARPAAEPAVAEAQPSS